MKKHTFFGAVAGLIGLFAVLAAGPAGAEDFDHAFNAYGAGDFEGARAMLQPLAEGGDTRAQFLLGRIYSEGQGVEKNAVESIKWYGMAATAGDVTSQLSLGTLYVNGVGVKQDLIQAYGWLTIVSKSDKRDAVGQALEVRDLIEQMMSSDQIKQAKALAAGWKPQ